MSKLCTRDQAKAVIGLRDDATDQDDLIDLMIEMLTDLVLEYSMRTGTFAAAVRDEYFPSYEQMMGDPQAQYIWLNALTVDLSQPFSMSYSSNGDHVNNYRALVAGTDYVLNSSTTPGADVPVVIIQPTGLTGVFSVPFDPRGQLYWDTPRGFRVQYTGGVALVGDLLTMPKSIQAAAAQKVGQDFLKGRTLGPLLPTEEVWFKLLRKRHIL